MIDCGVYWVSVMGPAPTGLVLKPFASACTAVGDTGIVSRPARSSKNDPMVGVFIVIFTVEGSITSTVPTLLISGAKFVFLAATERSIENFTAAASSGVPSENLRLGRSFRVTVLSPWTSYDCASPGL